jgi:GntR family transcriptional regulator of vanillate catabolism
MSEQSRVIHELRRMILRGEYGAGERITELSVAEKLGVSRTPVRVAFGALEREGLLTVWPAGGYTVTTFTPRQISDAFEVRGLLEGFAARLLAEKGLPRDVARQLRACLEEGDEIFAQDTFDVATDFERYVDMNARFHALIVDNTDNQPLKRALTLNDAVPFTSAHSLVFNRTKAIGKGFRLLSFLHFQHHAILEAIEAGEGARAEAAMREHAYTARQNLGKINEAVPPDRLVRLMCA